MKLRFSAVALIAIACNNDVTGLEPPSNPATETFAPSLNVNIAQMTRLPSGTYIRDITTGTGAEVVAATDTVWVSYAGYLKNGTLFDSGNNVKFDPDGLVPGFKAGLLGMRVGGERLMVIPSDQAYGPETQRNPATGKIIIPRQSTLIFRVTLIKVYTPTSGTGTTT